MNDTVKGILQTALIAAATVYALNLLAGTSIPFVSGFAAKAVGK